MSEPRRWRWELCGLIRSRRCEGFARIAAFRSIPGTWWAQQALPDPTPPNNVIAGLWGDFEVVYDPVARSGVRLVLFGPTGQQDGPEGWAVIDYDRMQRYGGSSASWSTQLWIRRTPNPATPEVVVAYNNLGPLDIPVTIGLEDLTGTSAAALVNNAPAAGSITSSTVVCFNYVGAELDPEVITYQVTVDSDAYNGTATNRVVHDTDNPGSRPAETSAGVLITGGRVSFPQLHSELDALAAAGGITTGLEAKIRHALNQAELWLTLEKLRPIAHTHLERAVHLLLWQADVIEQKGKPNQGDPAGLRALAGLIQRYLQEQGM